MKNKFIFTLNIHKHEYKNTAFISNIEEYVFTWNIIALLYPIIIRYLMWGSNNLMVQHNHEKSEVRMAALFRVCYTWLAV